MEDRYEIRIPDDVGDRMSAWDIPADIRLLMDERLRVELASEPAKHLTPCFAPWGERLNLYAQPFQRGRFRARSSRSVEVWPPFWYAAFFGGGFFGPRGCFR